MTDLLDRFATAAASPSPQRDAATEWRTVLQLVNNRVEAALPGSLLAARLKALLAPDSHVVPVSRELIDRAADVVDQLQADLLNLWTLLTMQQRERWEAATALYHELRQAGGHPPDRERK